MITFFWCPRKIKEIPHSSESGNAVHRLFSNFGIQLKTMLNSRIFLLAVLIVFSSCKRPLANFTTDKTSYKGGDTVYLTNMSRNATTYSWYMNDQPIGNSEDMKFKLDGGTAEPVAFRLVASNKNRKTESTRRVSVTPLTGTLTVWSSNAPQNVDIMKMGFSWHGQIFFPYTDDPGCEATGCVFGEMPVGTYTVFAAGPFMSTQSVVNVIADSCVRFRVP